jgi:AcrR family transcriptional regulator
VTAASRGLRRDAERNRVRILEAAMDLVAERGLDIGLNDVAHRAGVGVGTVYRRFPDKEHLLEALFVERLGDVVGVAEEAADEPSGWVAVCRWLERSLSLHARNRALRALLLGTPNAEAHVAEVRARLRPIGEGFVGRAQAEGSLRSDVGLNDVIMIDFMLGLMIDRAGRVDADIVRRIFRILLDGLLDHRPQPSRLPGRPPSDKALDRVWALNFRSRRR